MPTINKLIVQQLKGKQKRDYRYSGNSVPHLCNLAGWFLPVGGEGHSRQARAGRIQDRLMLSFNLLDSLDHFDCQFIWVVLGEEIIRAHLSYHVEIENTTQGCM